MFREQQGRQFEAHHLFLKGGALEGGVKKKRVTIARRGP